ncbi:MAG TPA: hypothetical protein VFK07_00865 [Candidatus Paceibacterota bacterium]|nr:hypothetical protein [Candidatus Paceibacterota bacterium]
MINWHILFSIASPVLAIWSVVPYIKDTIKGSTRPNTVTWSLWVFILVIALGAQLSSGWSSSIIFIVANLVGTAIVAVLSFSKRGYRHYGRIEWGCLFFCIAAVIFWRLTSQPMMAIFFAISADLMAGIPTIIKAYEHPRSEYPLSWFILSFAAILGVLSNQEITLANSLFSGYLFIINGIIGLLSYRA